MDAIKSIYVNLSEGELLKRCIGTYSQNLKESLNHILWKEYDVHPGAQAINLAIEVDRKRIYFSDYQQESSSKEARTERLKRLHGPNDDSYIPGGH
ncbi:hypothetical protein TKK_0012432 [Trichogramma kaykai]